MTRSLFHGAFPEILVVGLGVALRRLLALLVHGFRGLLTRAGSRRSPRIGTTQFIVLGSIGSAGVVTGLV
jgi:hypothetical protein